MSPGVLGFHPCWRVSGERGEAVRGVGVKVTWKGMITMNDRI